MEGFVSLGSVVILAVDEPYIIAQVRHGRGMLIQIGGSKGIGNRLTDRTFELKCNDIGDFGVDAIELCEYVSKSNYTVVDIRKPGSFEIVKEA